jgi:hypothetical protein
MSIGWEFSLSLSEILYAMPTHYELPIGAFVAAFLVLIPLPWHWRARNVPTLSIIAWLFVSNIILGVNTIIWADSIDITAVVWCDIGAFTLNAIPRRTLTCHSEQVADWRNDGAPSLLPLSLYSPGADCVRAPGAHDHRAETQTHGLRRRYVLGSSYH